jgi:hypothetical protein
VNVIPPVDIARDHSHLLNADDQLVFESKHRGLRPLGGPLIGINDRDDRRHCLLLLTYAERLHEGQLRAVDGAPFIVSR